MPPQSATESGVAQDFIFGFLAALKYTSNQVSLSLFVGVSVLTETGGPREKQFF